jgi:hypothetical protein
MEFDWDMWMVVWKVDEWVVQMVLMKVPYMAE